jgi:hypothetical protein
VLRAAPLDVLGLPTEQRPERPWADPPLAFLAGRKAAQAEPDARKEAERRVHVMPVKMLRQPEAHRSATSAI